MGISIHAMVVFGQVKKCEHEAFNFACHYHINPLDKNEYNIRGYVTRVGGGFGIFHLDKG
jgi:hypothetical protein